MGIVPVKSHCTQNPIAPGQKFPSLANGIILMRNDIEELGLFGGRIVRGQVRRVLQIDLIVHDQSHVDRHRKEDKQDIKHKCHEDRGLAPLIEHIKNFDTDFNHLETNPMDIRLFSFLILFFSPALGFTTEIMFEGYYRINLATKPIGYNILRFEYDAKTSTFNAISFQRATVGKNLVQESLKAKSSDKFKPISYQYTSQVNQEFKTIDATFSGEVMTIKVSDGKKVRNEKYKIPKGTFLSSFLPFLLMLKKLDPNTAFEYSAVAEEEGNSYTGKAFLKSRDKREGYDLLSIRNRYQGKEFDSTMAIVKDRKDPSKNIKGEVFSTLSDANNISTELVSDAAQATVGQVIPDKILLSLFGQIPTGKVNLKYAEKNIEKSDSIKNSDSSTTKEP